MAKKNKKHPQEETELLEEQPAQQDDVSGAQRPRRKSGKSIVAIVLLVLAILLFVAGGALGLLYYQSYQDLEEMKAVVDVQGFYPGITIDGQDVGGRSYEEVREEILARQQAEADARVITVACEGQTYTLPAQSSYDTEQVIVDAYNYAKEGDLTQRYQLVTALQTQPLDFATTCTVTVEGVDAFVQRIAEAIDVPAQDATVGSFDVETKTFAFTDELPGPDVAARRPLTTHDVWGFLDSQETTGISPDMYAEFIYPYYRRIAEQYGMLSYGCCEAVDPVWDKCLHEIPNLRKVSISPWCNEEMMGERLRGTNIVYHRKPTPNILGTEVVLNEDAVRACVTKTMNAARGCEIEFSQRDVYTVHNDMAKVRRYVELIRECSENA